MSYYEDIKKAAYEAVVNCHKYNAIIKISLLNGKAMMHEYLSTNFNDKEIIAVENIIKYVADVSNVFVCKHPLDACNFFKTEYDFEKVYTEAQEIYAKLLDFDIITSQYLNICQQDTSLRNILYENSILDMEEDISVSNSSYRGTFSNVQTPNKILIPNRKLKVKWTYENIPDLNQGIIR